MTQLRFCTCGKGFLFRVFFVTLLFMLVSCSQKKEPEKFTIISYNIWNGFEGEESRKVKFAEWAQMQNADVFALEEVNNFTQDSLSQFARSWGHPYAVILKEEVYPVAITSKYPITNVQRLMDGMHHGALFVTTNGIRFGIVHLSPFSSVKRLFEAKEIEKTIRPYLSDQTIKGAVLLGDFNAYSPHDSAFYNATGRLESLQRSDASNEVHQNLNVSGQIDYDVIQFFNDKGFMGSVELLGVPFERSFPTNVFDGVPSDQGKERIDHVLLSPSLHNKCLETIIMHDNVTDMLSDHYPVKVVLKNS